MKFNHNSKWDIGTLEKKFSHYCSKKIIKLYKSEIFQKLQLNSNELIKQTIEHEKDNILYLKNEIPKENSLSIQIVSFFEIIPIENLKEFQSNLLKLLSIHKSGFPYKDPQEIAKSLNEIENRYKGFSWGNFGNLDLKRDPKLDLVDSISLHYTKGEESTFVIEYRIKPSAKFMKLFKELIIKDSEEGITIHLNSLKNIIKSKRLSNKISYETIHTDYFVNRLIQDLNFQIKSNVGKMLEFGLFQKSKDYLYPCIFILQVDKKEYFQYENAFNLSIGIENLDTFISGRNDQILHMPYANLTKKPFEIFSIIFLKESILDHGNLKNKQNNEENYSISANNYLKSISPIWCAINFYALNQAILIKQRKETFKYLNKNKDSLFLKEAIKLKYEILHNSLTMKRITKDYSDSIFKTLLNYFPLPKSYRRQNSSSDFKSEILRYVASMGADIANEFQNLNSIFKEISEDNVTRSNMKIQRILIMITILGILVAVYSSNASYFNNLVNCKLNHIFKLIVNL